MVELNYLVDVFNNVDGIEANTPANRHKALVKVTDESAMGDFWQIVREYDVDRSRTTRGDLEWTVLDTWVHG